jgi:hypothetical protein
MNRAIALAFALLALTIVTPSNAQDGKPTPAPAPPSSGDEFDSNMILGNFPREHTDGAMTAQRVADRVAVLMRTHMRRCWRTQEDSAVVVTVTFELNRDGSLDGRPEVTSPEGYAFDPDARRAADAARDAITACAPYPFAVDPIASEHYDLWREMEIRFDPRTYGRPSPANR